MNRLALAAVGALALLTSSISQAQEGLFDLEPATVTAEQDGALTLAAKRGQWLYLYDRAAWYSTDALLEDIADPAGAGIMGWVVTQEPDGLRVTYWTEQGEGFAGVYSAFYDGAGVTRRRVLEGEDRQLSALQLSLIQAQLAISFEGIFRCKEESFNSVILPPEEEGGPVLFYLLTPQTSNQSVPAGGHFRFDVLNGEVVSSRKFTNSCLELLLVAPDGESRPVATTVTHTLDPQPTELHFFTMLTGNLPLYVMTTENDLIWQLGENNGAATIELMGKMPKQD